MIVIMEANIQLDDSRVSAVMEQARKFGLNPESKGVSGTAYTVVQVLLKDGSTVKSSSVAQHFFEALPGVEAVQRVTPPSVSLAHNGNGHCHQIQIGGVKIGTGLPCRLVAGPCTVDKRIGEVAGNLRSIGVNMIRGGCWKPRSGPDSFPGFGEVAVQWLLSAAARYDMEAVFLEVIESEHIDVVRRIRDEVGYRGTIVLWVGARTGNTILLRKLGEQREFPVMLKNGVDDRGIDDLAARAEWVLARRSVWDVDGQLIKSASLTPGNDQVILCLRGTRKTDRHSPFRFVPNHSWMELIQREWWAPGAIDPSHSAGEEGLVIRNIEDALRYKPALLMVEGGYGNDGYRGLCDMAQSLSVQNLLQVIKLIAGHNKVTYGQEEF